MNLSTDGRVHASVMLTRALAHVLTKLNNKPPISRLPETKTLTIIVSANVWKCVAADFIFQPITGQDKGSSSDFIVMDFSLLIIAMCDLQ